MAARKQAKKAGQAAQATPKQLKSWSYSTYSNWKRCARRVYFGKIERLPDPLGPAVKRGSTVHDLAEAFVKGETDEFPTRGPGKILTPFRPDLEKLRDDPTIQVETDFSFTKEWKPTKWNDWANCWVRMKLDALYRPKKNHFVLVDYKTGQKRDEHVTQTELYALGCFMKHSAAKKVTTELWYLDHPEDDDAITTFDYEREEAAKLKAEWERKVKPMMADTEFRAYPSSACSYCPFSKKKGGPCEKG